MPVYIDISENEVLGPPYKDGQRTILRHQIAKRFGSVPDWVEQRLAGLSGKELEALSERVLDAPTIEQLFQ